MSIGATKRPPTFANRLLTLAKAPGQALVQRVRQVTHLPAVVQMKARAAAQELAYNWRTTVGRTHTAPPIGKAAFFIQHREQLRSGPSWRRQHSPGNSRVERHEPNLRHQAVEAATGLAEGAAARVNDLLTTPYKIAEFAASPAGDEFRSRPEVFLARLAAAGVKHAQRLAFDIPSGKAFDDATKPLREGSIRERCAAAGGLAVDVATILPVARLARVGGGVLRSLEALGKPVQLAGEYELGYRVSQGGRSLAPLTEGQKLDVVEYSRALNLPEDKIAFMEEGATGYLGNWDYMMVGRDVAPNPQAGLGTRSANGRVSLRGAVAHELVGHREAHLAGRTQANLVLEEAQASIRAARFAPGLTSTERITLLRDGVARLNQNGYRIRQVKSELFIEVR